MLAILRAWAIAFLLLTVLYWMLRIYFRSLRREALEKQYDTDAPQGDAAADRATYIESGMKDYDRSLRPRLLWLVYILPLTAIALIIYFVNYD